MDMAYEIFFLKGTSNAQNELKKNHTRHIIF